MKPHAKVVHNPPGEWAVVALDQEGRYYRVATCAGEENARRVCRALLAVRMIEERGTEYPGDSDMSGADTVEWLVGHLYRTATGKAWPEYACTKCQDGGVVSDTCDECDERHCAACERCEVSDTYAREDVQP